MPTFHEQLCEARYPLPSGAALVTQTFLRRAAGTYVLQEYPVEVFVVSSHVGGPDLWRKRPGTGEWHAAVRIGVQTALHAARGHFITDLVLSDDACVSDTSLLSEFLHIACDVLRSHEFAGAFETVVFAVCRGSLSLVSTLLARFVCPPTLAQAALLADRLDEYLKDTRGWTKEHGSAVPVAELSCAMCGMGDVTLAVAAKVLYNRGGWQFAPPSDGSVGPAIKQGQPLAAGLRSSVPPYRPPEISCGDSEGVCVQDHSGMPTTSEVSL